MAFDASAGGDPRGPWCKACKQPIAAHDSVDVHFNSDPSGARGLSGLYHRACSKPFASLARIINMSPRG